jgi:hypothetical protein
MEALWVPIVMFLSVGAVVALGLMFRFRARAEVQKTLRQAIERGQEMTPEFLEHLGDPPRSPTADLRRGIIAMALGVGFGVFAIALGEEDAVRPMLGVASFPFMLGVAYLFLWKIAAKSE